MPKPQLKGLVKAVKQSGQPKSPSILSSEPTPLRAYLGILQRILQPTRHRTVIERTGPQYIGADGKGSDEAWLEMKLACRRISPEFRFAIHMLRWKSDTRYTLPYVRQQVGVATRAAN